MGKKESDVVLNFKMDGQVQYATTLKEINGVMNTAAKEYKTQISAMGQDASETAKLTAAKKKLEIQLEGAEKRTEMLRKKYEESVKETGEYSKESQKLYKALLDSETGENKLKSALEDTNEALKKQGDVSVSTAEKIKKIEEAGEKVKGVGKGMSVGLTAPILAIGAASLSAFKELDNSLDSITTATGARGDQLDSLQESFKNVVKVIPAEMEDISTGIGEVYTQFGLMGDELEGTTERMLKFSEINESDVSQSTINAKKSVDLFRLSVKDVPMVLDVMSKTSQDTGVSVDQLFDAVNKGAPQLKNMGLGFAESTTLIGQMEKAGIDSAGAIGYLAKANVNYAKDGKTMQDGLNGTIESIRSATNEQDKLTVASEVFGAKAAPKMVEAIDSGALSMDGLGNSAANAAGTVDQTFTAILDPIDQAKLAQNQMKVGMGELGEQVQIALLPTFEAASKAISSLTEWFRGLSDEQKQTIVKVAGIIAAVGPLLVILGTVMGSVTKIITGVKMLGTVLGFLTSPFGLIVIAIAAFIAGLVWAYNNVEWFRDGVNSAFSWIGDFASKIFTSMMDLIGSKIDGIKQYFGGLIDFLTGVFTGNWSKAWDGIKDIFQGVMKMLPNGMKAPINAMIGMINGFIGGLSKIKIPKWVPGIGGKGFSIPQIPMLATGGHLLNGQAIVGEAGPELLSNRGGKTTVTPLNENEKKKGITGNLEGGNVEQHIHIGAVNTNSMNEVDRLNRNIAKASKKSRFALGGA